VTTGALNVEIRRTWRGSSLTGKPPRTTRALRLGSPAQSAAAAWTRSMLEPARADATAIDLIRPRRRRRAPSNARSASKILLEGTDWRRWRRLVLWKPCIARLHLLRHGGCTRRVAHHPEMIRLFPNAGQQPVGAEVLIREW